MTPEDVVITPEDNIVTEQQPSLTYRINNNRIAGKVDGIDAVRQAVSKILLTERFQYLIYNSDYGVELNSLIGQPQGYVQADIKRRITEALMQDDRIRNVTDFNIQFDGDIANVAFTVVSVYGSFNEEVIANV
jgi:phage baseplate assembly protein W